MYSHHHPDYSHSCPLHSCLWHWLQKRAGSGPCIGPGVPPGRSAGRPPGTGRGSARSAPALYAAHAALVGAAQPRGRRGGEELELRNINCKKKMKMCIDEMYIFHKNILLNILSNTPYNSTSIQEITDDMSLRFAT